jgi:hypothetical protein
MSSQCTAGACVKMHSLNIIGVNVAFCARGQHRWIIAPSAQRPTIAIHVFEYIIMLSTVSNLKWYWIPFAVTEGVFAAVAQ